MLHVFFVHICQVFFDEERNAQEVRSKGVNSSIPSHSCLRVTRRIPIASQNDSLHNLNEVDSLNGKLAPKLNSPSEHFDTVDNSIPVYVAKGDESIRPMSNKACSSVEIARGYTSGFLSDDVSMEHHLSSPEHENQSHYHEMTPTSIDNSGAEFDFNVSDTGLENAESPPSEHLDIVDNSIPVSVAKGDESICPMSNKACSSVEITRVTHLISHPMMLVWKITCHHLNTKINLTIMK